MRLLLMFPTTSVVVALLLHYWSVVTVVAAFSTTRASTTRTIPTIPTIQSRTLFSKAAASARRSVSTGSAAATEGDEDFVSDSSLSFVDDIACNDATALKRELLFLKGAMKEKDEELTRLREEKNESIASKFSLMEEIGSLKKEVEIKAKMLLQVSKEKEQAMEQVKDIMVEMAKILVHVQNEKDEAAKEIQVSKEKLEESNQKISKSVEEKEVAIESARKSKKEGATTTIEELEHRVKISECEFAELFEKCSAESEMVRLFQADTKKEIAELQIVAAELEENVKEGMTEMLVQAAKEEVEKATRGRKAEIADMVKTLVDTALNEQKASVLDVMTINREATSKLVQTELSLQDALQKISNLEKEGAKEKNTALPLTVWKSSGTKLVSHSSNSDFYDVLNCAPLKSGTFEWKIQVHFAQSNWLCLGVIGSSLKLPLDNWIGFTKKTWGYWSKSNSCRTYYWNDQRNDIKNLPKYTARSVVHFVLDLTKDGTLCVSVDESPLFQLFSKMKSSIDHDEGFLPATSMHYENKIELLEFKCR